MTLRHLEIKQWDVEFVLDRKILKLCNHLGPGVILKPLYNLRCMRTIQLPINLSFVLSSNQLKPKSGLQENFVYQP